MAYLLLIIIAGIIISRWPVASEDPYNPKEDNQYAPVKEYRYTHRYGRHKYTNVNTVMLKKYTSIMTTDEYNRYEDLIFGVCGVGFSDIEVQDLERRLREKKEKRQIAKQLLMFNLRESA